VQWQQQGMVAVLAMVEPEQRRARLRAGGPAVRLQHSVSMLCSATSEAEHPLVLAAHVAGQSTSQMLESKCFQLDAAARMCRRQAHVPRLSPITSQPYHEAQAGQI
jgi:hypothetical protein